MDKQQIIDYLLTEKEKAIKLQIYEVASILRGLENSFKGQFGKEQEEVTVENFILLLNYHMVIAPDIRIKSYLKAIVRDIKIYLISR